MCSFLLETYAVLETSVTHMFCYHRTLVHWLLYYWYYALNSHSVLSIPLLDENLTSQCSWECKKTPRILWIAMHGQWLYFPVLKKKKFIHMAYTMDVACDQWLTDSSGSLIPRLLSSFFVYYATEKLERSGTDMERRQQDRNPRQMTSHVTRLFPC